MNPYDEIDYIKAMKKFKAEARGLIPGSIEYHQIRNRIYKELSNQADNYKAKKTE